MIDIKSMTFSYDNKNIFENFNLHIPRNKFISIIGPNGCGKSTLLKLISKELKQSSGEIYVDNKNIQELKPIDFAKILAFNRQQVSNIFPFTCLDYVMLGRRPYKNQFEDYNLNDFNLVEKYLKETFTYEFLEKKLNQVSGGELQRINLAKILIQETEIILLDESFSAMDVYYTVSNLNLLKKIVKKNVTIICVMHDLNLVYQYSDHIILLNHGKVYKSGKADDVLTVETIKDVYKIDVEKIENKGFYIIGG